MKYSQKKRCFFFIFWCMAFVAAVVDVHVLVLYHGSHILCFSLVQSMASFSSQAPNELTNCFLILIHHTHLYSLPKYGLWFSRLEMFHIPVCCGFLGIHLLVSLEIMHILHILYKLEDCVIDNMT